MTELERLLQSARPFESDSVESQHSIWSILMDIGSDSERMLSVCQLAACESFLDDESDALLLISANELGVTDEDRHDREADQLAKGLARDYDPQSAVKSLSNMPFSMCVAVVAKLGVFNKSFLRRIETVLERVIQNPDLMGW